MMGKIQLKKTIQLSFFGIIIAGAVTLLPTSNSYAQGGGADSGATSTPTAGSNCQVIGGNLFPTPSHVSQYGDYRPPGSRGPRRHTGLDLFYPPNQTVPQPPGCRILLNDRDGYRFNNQNVAVDNSSGQLLGTNTSAGYGTQLFYECGKPDGDQITLRYAHVPTNPLTASKQILQGCSGSAGCSPGEPHYHFEIVIGNRPVDPECAMYGIKPAYGIRNTARPDGSQDAIPECRTCPPQLPPGPANLCDRGVRDLLIQHGKLCSTTSRFPDGQTKNVPGGNAIDPDRLGQTNGQADPEQGTGTPSPGAPHDHNDGDDRSAPSGGGSTTPNNILDQLFPPLEPDGSKIPLPPEQPPEIGTSGGPASLVPEPEEGQVPDEVSGCAADTWTAMTNQAVQEARREDLLNKRFIIKPDSVLQYSCFGNDIANAASSSSVFSGSQRWANLPVDLIGKQVTIQIYENDSEVEEPYRADLLKPNTLEESLSLLVDESFGTYAQNQFGHAGLAGTTGLSAEGELCLDMSEIWKAAKCKHFDGTDVFYSFEDLITQDPREFPPNMRCN